ncbi:hypothetical protein EDD22DRAFT_848155 [Suillus occidentalis]|nr:hypothetical protein EDD22DRAFT_848155 [Suillus occidentalis]
MTHLSHHCFSLLALLLFSVLSMCWGALKSSIWAGNFIMCEKMKGLFETYRHPHGLMQHTFYSPFKMCPNSTCDHTCKGLLLDKAEQHKTVYFSLFSALPAYSVQLYCESCRTMYHNTDIVQVVDHYYVNYQVARLWKAMMHAFCMSATNCTHIYNIALANIESAQFPDTKLFTKATTMDHVWNIFIICALLEDCHKHHYVLNVSQTINQNKCFIDAISDRNQRIYIYNQPLAYQHSCAKCTRVYDHGDASKLVSIIVMDGIIVSHPYCSIPNCWVHLHTPQDYFCPAHSTHLNQCAIKGCVESVVSSSLTCNIPTHQESEALHTLWGKSRFHLHEHLKCSHAIHGHLANVQARADDDGNGDGTEAIREEEYDVRSGRKKKKLHVQFTHNYTHCEELIVAPCGMIHACETMHNAEGIRSVAEFIHCVF